MLTAVIVLRRSLPGLPGVGWAALAAAVLGILAQLLLPRSRRRAGVLSPDIDAVGHAADISSQLALHIKIWRRWKGLSREMADFQARVLLGLMYLTVVAPLALWYRMSSDPLQLRPATGDSGWQPRAVVSGSLEDARRQF